MVYNFVFWLNSFPHKNGIHATMSPTAIMMGKSITYDKHCKLEFVTYVQTHEKHNNSMGSRTSGAIALRPSGNKQGGHYLVENILKKLNDKFGQESPLTTCHGKVLEYIGMKMDYRQKGKVKFSMYEYIKKMLEELPTNMEDMATTPASSHLFNTDPGCKKLCEEQGQLFHHLVAKLLCTRVREPDTDDYKKLTKVMQYIRNTRDMTLTIEPDDIAKWWVESSYTVHPEMKSHTGIYMKLVKGAMYTTSCKQKLNTKSSTEAELVAVDDAMGQVLWTRHILAAQGHFVPKTTIYQDNKSTILIAENGKSSSSKRTRHINVRYFFITDKIKKGEVTVAFCPTTNMLADFFTKPLQGSAFKRMRSIILNMPDTDKSSIKHRSVLVNKILWENEKTQIKLQ